MSGAVLPGLPRPWTGRSWLTIGGVILVTALGAGVPWYALGILFSPLVGEFHWGRGAYSLATGIYMVAMIAGSAPVGGLVDRWGSRPVMLAMALASAVAWGMLAQLGRSGTGAALWQLYGLIGLASSGLGAVPASALIARRFAHRRGLAMGLSVVGGSLPGVILVPLSAPLMAAYGWRALAFLLGALMLVVGLPSILWLLGDSASAREQPAQAPPRERGLPGAARQAVGTQAFWIIGLARLLSEGCSTAVQMHAIPFLMDRGLTRGAASFIWGFLALSAIAGKVGLGWAADRLSARAVLLASMALQCLSVAMALAFPGVPAAWLFALLFGLGMGGQYCARSLIVADYFDLRAYGAIRGLLTFFTLPGYAGGGPLAGYLYDLRGSYRLPYSLFVGAWLAGVLILLPLRRPARPVAQPLVGV